MMGCGILMRMMRIGLVFCVRWSSKGLLKYKIITFQNFFRTDGSDQKGICWIAILKVQFETNDDEKRPGTHSHPLILQFPPRPHPLPFILSSLYKPSSRLLPKQRPNSTLHAILRKTTTTTPTIIIIAALINLSPPVPNPIPLPRPPSD